MSREFLGRLTASALIPAALAGGFVALPAPAFAQPWGSDAPAWASEYRHDVRDRRPRGDQRFYRDRGYDDRRGFTRGFRCRDRGTGGTIIGAIAGGLLGDAVVGRRGDRTAGAIVGAGVGALAGRAIDRSDGRPC